jgi:uncharacterized protein YbaR (Trm112 family)
MGKDMTNKYKNDSKKIIIVECPECKAKLRAVEGYLFYFKQYQDMVKDEERIVLICNKCNKGELDL